MKTLDFARSIVTMLEEKKAENIILMDIHEIATFTDYFIICEGTSDRMLGSLSDAVHQKSKEDLDFPVFQEGNPSDGWMVVDCGDLVIHLFQPDQRRYYKLEQLWEKGKILLRLQ